ncbi:MAG: o-succinylbenzoate---CoA ligase, partial [Chloroflexota bacterium]|nr:o-succinylbenzoate---CoA ligase [Chloroflexota bacterium]
MSLTHLRRSLRAGDLVAVAIPPSRAWLPALRVAGEVGAAVLPVDSRLTAAERAALFAVAQPTISLGTEGLRRLDGMPAGNGVALVIATSGTSGHPRLVELTRDAVTAAIRASATAIGAGGGDRWLSCLPLAHIGGLLVPYRHLLLGAPITFRRRLTPAALAALPDLRCTSMVPTQLLRLLDAGTPLHRFRAIL